MYSDVSYTWCFFMVDFDVVDLIAFDFDQHSWHDTHSLQQDRYHPFNEFRPLDLEQPLTKETNQKQYKLYSFSF